MVLGDGTGVRGGAGSELGGGTSWLEKSVQGQRGLAELPAGTSAGVSL